MGYCMDAVNALKKALEFVAKWEWEGKPNGGYTNDPLDPGGETKYGISKRAHPNEDIKNLTPERALEIYKEEYWKPIDGDNQSYPNSIAYFDSAVNMGVERTNEWIVDCSGDITCFMRERKYHYYDIVNKNPRQVKYLRGWLNRLNDLSKLLEIEKAT